MIFVLGLPLFFMELALGQYNQCGAITCWKKICPLLSGVGYVVVLIAFYTDFYYNVIISWGFYYFFESFRSKLPWSSCQNTWNTKYCYEISSLLLNDNITNTSSISKRTFLDQNNKTMQTVSSSEEFFFNKLYNLGTDLGMHDLGSLLLVNTMCLALVFVICYFSMFRGVQTSGKVVWFTATFPYVVLLLLSIKALFLDGSMKGLEYYLTPDLSILSSPVVWMDAASQVYFSLGPGFGVLLAFSSYNAFNNNFYK